MHRFICAAVLALCSTGALAAWTSLGDLYDGTGFYDKATIRKTGDTVSVTILANFKEPDPPKNGMRGSASMIVVMEIDCGRNQLRRLSSEGHVEKDGKGFVTKVNNEPSAWKPFSTENFTRPDPMLKLRGIVCPARP